MEFKKRLGNITNSACIGFALSLAKDTGILQALLDAKEPVTSQQIADSKGLKERYVREVLDCLATAELVHVAKNASPEQVGAHIYHLEPRENRILNSSLLPYSAFPGALSEVYGPVKACFPGDGPYGTMYTEYVHDLSDEMMTYDVDYIADSILDSTEELREKLEKGIDVIEFGCGRGRLLAKLASMFPNSTFTASDVVPALLDKLRSHWGHIPNIQYSIIDLCALPDPPTKLYDWAFCVVVIHHLPHPLAALKGIRKLIKEPEGIFTFIEKATSGNPIDDKGDIDVAAAYAGSTLLCIPESFHSEDSEVVGACWGKQTAETTAISAGFNVSTEMIDAYHGLFTCRLQV